MADPKYGLFEPDAREKVLVEECLNYFGGSFDQVISGLFASDGNLWQVVGGTGAIGPYWTLLKAISTDWFLKNCRWRGRFLYEINSYARTAADALAILVMGEGFEYQTSDETKQKAIDEWVKKNKWKMESIERFIEYITQGEVFIRVFDGEAVRVVDPDAVLGDTVGTAGFRADGLNGVLGDTGEAVIYQGIITPADDMTQTVGFRVNNPYGRPGYKDVPATAMQHRSNGKFGLKRGFSWFLPIFKDLEQAAQLAGSNASALIQQTKIAYVREYDSDRESVMDLRREVGDGPCAPNAFSMQVGATGVYRENVEHYPEGTILDVNKGQTFKQVGLTDSEKSEIGLNILLRKISSRMRLPMSIMAADKSERGAYAAELVSNSETVRMIKSLQAKWIAWDLELLELAGFDTSDIQVVPPEVTMVDMSEEIAKSNHLMDNGMSSRKSEAKRFGVDYDAEQKQIKLEGWEPKADQEPSEDTLDGKPKGDDNGK